MLDVITTVDRQERQHQDFEGLFKTIKLHYNALRRVYITVYQSGGFSITLCYGSRPERDLYFSQATPACKRLLNVLFNRWMMAGEGMDRHVMYRATNIVMTFQRPLDALL